MGIFPQVGVEMKKYLKPPPMTILSWYMLATPRPAAKVPKEFGQSRRGKASGDRQRVGPWKLP